MSRLLLTRTKTPNLDEKYEIYLASNGDFKDASCNPLNLFDVVNVEDKAWFKLAQMYITQKGKTIYR